MGFIGSWYVVAELIAFAKSANVQQLTLRPVSLPLKSRCRDDNVYNWVQEHMLPEDDLLGIASGLDHYGDYLMTLAHGAPVYDVGGQNVCLADCLSVNKPAGSAIQMIYWPDGRVRFDWQFEGSVLL